MGHKYDSRLKKLITTPSFGPFLINPARADPDSFAGREYGNWKGSVLSSLSHEKPVRIACVTFGVVNTTNLKVPSVMTGKGQGLQVKSVGLVPLGHEWQRSVAFAEMAIGKVGKINAFGGNISFGTIPNKGM